MPDRVAIFRLARRDLLSLLRAGDGRTPYTLGGLPDAPEVLGCRWREDALELRVRSPELPEVPDGGPLPASDLLVGLVVPPPPGQGGEARTLERAKAWLEDAHGLDDATPVVRSLLACTRGLLAERDGLRQEVGELRLILGDYREDSAEADRLYRQGWREAMAQRDLQDAEAYERFRGVNRWRVTEEMTRRARDMAAGIEPGTVIDLPSQMEYVPPQQPEGLLARLTQLVAGGVVSRDAVLRAVGLDPDAEAAALAAEPGSPTPSPPAARYQPGLPSTEESRRVIESLDVSNFEAPSLSLDAVAAGEGRGSAPPNAALSLANLFDLPAVLVNGYTAANYASTLAQSQGWLSHHARAVREHGVADASAWPAPPAEGVTVEATAEGEVVTEVAEEGGPERRGMVARLPDDWLFRDYTPEAVEGARRAGEALGRRMAEGRERRVIAAVLGDTPSPDVPTPEGHTP